MYQLPNILGVPLVHSLLHLLAAPSAHMTLYSDVKQVSILCASREKIVKRNCKNVGVVNDVLDRRELQFYDYTE